MNLLTPKETGSPNADFFESPTTLKLLEGVESWMRKNIRKYIQTETSITSKTLASLIVQLIQFQDDHLGKNKEKPQFKRIPMNCMFDMQPAGALCHIMAALFMFKGEHQLSDFDFQCLSRVDHNLEMITQVRKRLISNKFIILPRVCIRRDVDEDTRKTIKRILLRNGCTITGSEDQATHVLFRDPRSDHTKETIKYARPFIKRDGMTLVHWCKLPASYDSWLSVDVPGKPPEFMPHYRKSWRVTVTWVLDSERYNEWMSEEDYEVDSKGHKKLHKLCFKFREKRSQGKRKKKSKRKRSRCPPKHDSRKGERCSLSVPVEDDLCDADDLSEDIDDPPKRPAIEEVRLSRPGEVYKRIKKSAVRFSFSRRLAIPS